MSNPTFKLSLAEAAALVEMAELGVNFTEYNTDPLAKKTAKIAERGVDILRKSIEECLPSLEEEESKNPSS